MVKFEGFGKALNDSTKILNNINKIGKLFDKIGSKSIFNGFKKKRKSIASGGEDIFNMASNFGLKSLKLPPIKKINDLFLPFSKVKTIKGADKFIKGFIGGFEKIKLSTIKAFNGIILVIKSFASKAGMSLGVFAASMVAVIGIFLFAAKLFKTMWMVNVGGMQTSVNKMSGRWKAGLAKVDLAFIKLARAFDPIIRPLVKIVELIGVGLIDGLLDFLSKFIDGIRFMMAVTEVLIGGFVKLIGYIASMFGNTDILDYGIKMSESGQSKMQELTNPQQTQAVTNNNITFNVGGSNMNEDAYMLFANRILQQIA